MSLCISHHEISDHVQLSMFVHGIRRKSLVRDFVFFFLCKKMKLKFIARRDENEKIFSSKDPQHSPTVKREREKRWRKENATWAIVKEKHKLSCDMCNWARNCSKFSFSKLVFSCNTLWLSIATICFFYSHKSWRLRWPMLHVCFSVMIRDGERASLLHKLFKRLQHVNFSLRNFPCNPFEKGGRRKLTSSANWKIKRNENKVVGKFS